MWVDIIEDCMTQRLVNLDNEVIVRLVPRPSVSDQKFWVLVAFNADGAGAEIGRWDDFNKAYEQLESLSFSLHAIRIDSEGKPPVYGEMCDD